MSSMAAVKAASPLAAGLLRTSVQRLCSAQSFGPLVTGAGDVQRYMPFVLGGASSNTSRSFAADAVGDSAVTSVNDRQPNPYNQKAVNAHGFAVGAPSASDANTGGHAGRTYNDEYVAPHKGLKRDLTVARPDKLDRESFMPHPVYGVEYVESVKPKHTPPSHLYQRVGQGIVWMARSFFDMISGYSTEPGKMTEAKWLQRMVFLETVAGVPGMVAGMLRHLKSLRTMRKDGGWIHSLLEEAENERMHLLTFMQLRKPGVFFRACVILAQGVFFNVYFISYLLSPRTAHAFVGYLEEEAVKTYTHALHDIDAGHLWKDVRAPPIAVTYWNLKPDATMRDLILVVRADEACHAHVNHVLSQRNPNDPNPFAGDESLQLP